MALIVEDGTCKVDSESYVSVSDADAYCTAHGLITWTGTDAVKEVALRNATQYIDSSYIFLSQKSTLTQALEFPRIQWGWDYPDMAKLRNATCELAVKALTQSLFADVDPQQVIKVKVGPIEKTTGPSNNGGQKRFSMIDSMLRTLTRGMGNISIYRA